MLLERRGSGARVQSIDGPHSDRKHRVNRPARLDQRQQFFGMNWPYQAPCKLLATHWTVRDRRAFGPPASCRTRSRNVGAARPPGSIDRPSALQRVLLDNLLDTQKQGRIDIAKFHHVQEGLLLPRTSECIRIVEA